MSTTLVQVRIDEKLKSEATAVYDSLGIDLSTAVRIFLKRSVLANGVPFDMTLPKSTSAEDKALNALLNLSNEAAKNGTSEMTLDKINAEIEQVRNKK